VHKAHRRIALALFDPGQNPQVDERCSNSKAVGAPTPDGFAFVPHRPAFLGGSRWVSKPASVPVRGGGTSQSDQGTLRLLGRVQTEIW
jgi:hypothetical protein